MSESINIRVTQNGTAESYTVTQGARGPVGATGATGPAGPSPSGTGLVSVTSGVLDTPSTLSARVAADAANLRTQLGLPVEVKSANFTAENRGRYVVTATCAVTDPAAPSDGHEFEVIVRNGTATIGGTAYNFAGESIRRIYYSGSWKNYKVTPILGLLDLGGTLGLGAGSSLSFAGESTPSANDGAYVEMEQQSELILVAGTKLDTSGTGTIVMGADGTRTTLSGSATQNRTQTFPDASGTVMLGSQNLSGLSNAATARTNLGAGTTGDALFTASTFANALSVLGTVTKVAASAQNVASSTTHVDDAELTFTVEANKVYRLEFFIHFVAGAGGISPRLILPSVPVAFTSSPQTGVYAGLGLSAQIVSLSTTMQLSTLAGATAGRSLAGTLMLAIGTSGGTLKFQFAQQASDAANTTRTAGSWMTLTRLN